MAVKSGSALPDAAWTRLARPEIPKHALDRGDDRANPGVPVPSSSLASLSARSGPLDIRNLTHPHQLPDVERTSVRDVLYRFLDAMGDVLDERECIDHSAALAWARDNDELEDEVQRVEFLGPQGDWRWAGPLTG